VLAPALIAGIYRVALPVFAVASLVSGLSWTLSTGLGAYLLGPAASDILSHIGVRGVIAIVIIAAVGCCTATSGTVGIRPRPVSERPKTLDCTEVRLPGRRILPARSAMCGDLANFRRRLRQVRRSQ
jgi:hypothetical protein